MAEPTTQTYATHRRYVWGFHGFVLGVLALNLIVTVVHAWRAGGRFAPWQVVLALALVGLAYYVRSFPLRAQDRIIRLEERLRLATVLPEPLRGRIGELTERQLIALRFAPDAELPGLVEQALAEKLGSEDIKKRIRGWRPDTFRV